MVCAGTLHGYGSHHLREAISHDLQIKIFANNISTLNSYAVDDTNSLPLGNRIVMLNIIQSARQEIRGLPFSVFSRLKQSGTNLITTGVRVDLIQEVRFRNSQDVM